MNLRDFQAGDLEAVWALNQANVPAVGDVTKAALERLVSQSCQTLVSLDDAGKLIGFALVLEPGADYHSVNYRYFSAHYDDFIYLDRVAVGAAWQGRGVGAAMYEAISQRFAHRAWFTLEVNVRPRNEGSLRFHQRLGFVEVGQQETPYGARVSLLARPVKRP